MIPYFTRVVVLDFEYEVVPGDLPDVLCMVAHVLDEHLNHVRTVAMWRGEFGDCPPFDTANTLIVGYSLWAELTCFMQLGWTFPTYVLDLHTTYLSASNILAPYTPDEPRKKERKRLSDACKAYGVSGWEDIDKETIAKDIGEGRWRIYGRPRVTEYCNEDVRAAVELLRKMASGWAKFRPIDAQLVMHWSNYSAKAVAQIQARGMPIDMHLWDLVQENKETVIKYLLRRFDPSYGSDYPIYTPDGHWSYAQFESWLKSVGITAWQRLQSGQLDISSKVFKLNGHLPGIERLHALRDSLGVIVKAKLPIGRDGRNRPSLFPFGTATGRNAHAKSLFNAHAGLRSFMVAPAGGTLVYLDWRTQEVGIAGALSGDRALMGAYEDGDVYYALARLCELTSDTNMVRWKRENLEQRQRMKSLQLAINYGMGVASLARGLGRHRIVATAIIEKHKRQYARFWEWRADRVRSAMIERQIDSVFGWSLHLSTSSNVRTLYNFPMQANGAEMLRIAACRMCAAGIVPTMLIHDGLLIEVAFSDPEAAWNVSQMALRIPGPLGDPPVCIITSTPRSVPAFKRIRALPTTVVTISPTMDNAANLSPEALASLVDQFGGTRLGRQELGAEMIDDVDGALWTRQLLEECRIRRGTEPERMRRVVVAIDPPGASGKTNAECGLIVAGVGPDRHGYIMADLSGRYTPEQWASKKAIGAYHSYKADRIVAEKNFGGEMVQSTLRSIDRGVPLKMVTASRGKQTRAEPVASWYEQHRIHHIGEFPDLEDQMCGWDPAGSGPSPDRIDAAV